MFHTQNAVQSALQTLLFVVIQRYLMLPVMVHLLR